MICSINWKAINSRLNTCFVESNINFKISNHALLFLWKLNSILCIRSFIRGVKKYASFQYPQTYRDVTKIWRIVTSQLMSRRKWNYEYHLRCKNMRFSNDKRWMCASFHGWENDFSPFSFIPIFLLFQFLSTLKLKLQFSISRFTKGRINPFTKDCWSCCTCFEWNSTLNIFFNLFQYLHGNARVKNRYNSVEMLS